MVEIEGERVLAASCKRAPAVGMKVKTASRARRKARAMVMELLGRRSAGAGDLARPDLALLGPGGFRAGRAQPISGGRTLAAGRQPPGHARQSRFLHPVQPVRARVPRSAGERRHRHGVPLASAPRWCSTSTIPMGESTCVACGECVQACPTGALMPAAYLDENQTRIVYPDREVNSLCPYCGVGCQVSYKVKDEKIIYAEGRDGPANHNRLCVKGRFGFDYIHHPHRLTKPLIRLDNVRQGLERSGRPGEPVDALSRGDLGGGPGSGRRGPEGDPRRPRARRRSPASAPRRARTRRRICSRSWCAPASARTTSITARACAMPPRSRRSWKD